MARKLEGEGELGGGGGGGGGGGEDRITKKISTFVFWIEPYAQQFA